MAAPRALEGSMMLGKVAVSYVPTLRLKEGEYRALKRLAPDVADRIVDIRPQDGTDSGAMAAVLSLEPFEHAGIHLDVKILASGNVRAGAGEIDRARFRVGITCDRSLEPGFGQGVDPRPVCPIFAARDALFNLVLGVAHDTLGFRHLVPSAPKRSGWPRHAKSTPP